MATTILSCDYRDTDITNTCSYKTFIHNIVKCMLW